VKKLRLKPELFLFARNFYARLTGTTSDFMSAACALTILDIRNKDVTRNVDSALGVGTLASVMNPVYSSSVDSAVTGLPIGTATAVLYSVGAAVQIAANAAFINGLRATL
jgi:hypothetical protein